MQDIIYSVLAEALASSFPNIQEENRKEEDTIAAFFHHWEHAEQIVGSDGIDQSDLLALYYHLDLAVDCGKYIWGEREKGRRGELFYVADPSHIDSSDSSSIYLTRTSGGWLGIENAGEMTAAQKIAAALTTESLEITTEVMSSLILEK